MNKWRLIGLLSGITLILFVLTAASLGNDINNLKDEVFEISIEETIAFQSQEFIEIDMSSEDVEFYVSNSDEFEISYYKVAGNKEEQERVTEDFVIESQNDGIRIYHKNRRLNWWKEMREHFLSDIISIANNYKNVLEVGLPASYIGDLSVDLSSGNIELSDHDLKHVILDLSSGNIQVDQLNCLSLTLESSSGNTIINNVEVEGSIDIDSTSGNVTILEFSSDELSVDLSSGNTVLKGNVNSFIYDTSSGNLDATEFYSLESNLDASSGDVTIQGNPGNIKAHLSSGRITLDYNSFDNNIWIDVSSGDIKLGLPSDSEFNLESHTSSGNFESDFEIISTINGDFDEDHLYGRIGTSDNDIYLKTSSGDIDLNVSE